MHPSENLFSKIFPRANLRECERLRFSRVLFVILVKKKCLQPPGTILKCPLLRVMSLRRRAIQPEGETISQAAKFGAVDGRLLRAGRDP